MAKTYTAAGTVVAGEVYTAAAHNIIATDVNNFIVPPAVCVVRTTDLTSYLSNADITWSSSVYDTDAMYSSGAIITITTPGIYVITFNGAITATPTMTSVTPSILKGASEIAYAGFLTASTQGFFTQTVVSSCINGDTIKCRLQPGGGSAYVVKGNASESYLQTRLTATWVGRTS